MLRLWRSKKLNARAGKKEGDWGEGPEGVASRPYGVKIFARYRFPIPIFSPPPNFVRLSENSNFENLRCLNKPKDFQKIVKMAVVGRSGAASF
ncbi:MAG: hypothetical protein A3B53_02165 [Candidatus Levybacteria bacterium RIFCSPLOWO2_01_FULL_42_15]|nr:MAG: hypothetical protein A3B53_02165 [Candidatus Levybacteria bacterium RIFCSPLOWO2_01_FULL_42_15]